MTAARRACDDADRDLLDAALGHLEEPRRSWVLAHAHGCDRCGRLLDELTVTGDRMLELAPEVEPPTGFDVTVVGHLAPRRPAAGRRRLVAAAAVVALVLAGLAGAFAGRLRHDEPSPVRDAVIVSRDGQRLGTAELHLATGPKLVLTMDGTSDWGGTWVCEVRTGAGEWVELGRWTAAEVTHGVWATGVPAAVTDVRAMRILGGSGAVIARADLTT